MACSSDNLLIDPAAKTLTPQLDRCNHLFFRQLLIIVINVNLRDLQYFAVVAEHRHLGRAAESLGLSQPALSMSVRRLERFMRVKLVKRTSKGMDLTASGEAVFAHARRLRLSVEEISREVLDLSEGRAGYLRIGSGAGSALYLVPAACATLLKEAPKATFKVITGSRQATLKALSNGELDVVIATILTPRLEDLFEEYLYELPFVVYASTNHRLAKRKQLTLADLAQERWVLSDMDNFAVRRLCQLCGESGLHAPTITMETTNPSIMHHLVATSELVGFTARQTVQYAAVRHPIVELRVKNLPVARRVGVYYRKDAYLSPVARRFIEILKAEEKGAAEDRNK
jgi:DNA-binding transcriptional LysR family regulator